jgi:signal transduction histidine kinase
LNDAQKAELLAKLRQNPSAALSTWLHHFRGSAGAILSAALLIEEIVVPHNDDPTVREMLDIINEKAEVLLALADVLHEMVEPDENGHNGP